MIQHDTITTGDGGRISCTRFVPAQSPTAIVLIGGAMGVRQEFYQEFAAFLAQTGFAVMTFDYRGIGRSIPEQHAHSLRGLETDITRWAEQDYNAALHVARSWHAGVPLYVIGHSLGGQLPGLLPDSQIIDGLMTIAAGNGYWRMNAAPARRLALFLWYIAVPFWTALFGYFPGRRLRKIGNLPKGVIRQWSRWCRNRHYVVDEQGQPLREGYAKIRIPMLSMIIDDDELLSPASINDLHDWYCNAPLERRHIVPDEVGARRIGHFGFFREQFRDTLWQQARLWLTQRHAAPGLTNI